MASVCRSSLETHRGEGNFLPSSPYRATDCGGNAEGSRAIFLMDGPTFACISSECSLHALPRCLCERIFFSEKRSLSYLSSFLSPMSQNIHDKITEEEAKSCDADSHLHFFFKFPDVWT